MEGKKKESIEEITKYKNKCIEIVQKLIEPINKTYSQKEILEDCSFITRAHFDDICEERACSDFCAYIFCDKSLSNSSENNFSKTQIYSIKNNILYDIKRRKLFCSDLCFKSSDHLRNEISTEFLSLRLQNVSLTIYNDKIGIPGDQVVLKPNPVTEEDIDISIPEQKIPYFTESILKKKLKNERSILKTNTRQDVIRKERQFETKISAPYVQNSTFKELKDQFQNLNINEKNIQNDFETFMDALESNASQGIDSLKNFQRNLVQESQEASQNLESEISEAEVFSGKIQEKNIDTLQTEIDKISVTTFSDISGISNSSKVRKLKRRRFLFDTISKFKQWSTRSTIELLKCDKNHDKESVGVDKSEDRDENEIDCNGYVFVEKDEQTKLETYRWEYIQLMAKLDLEEAEEDRLDKKLLAEGLSNNLSERKRNPKNKQKSVRFSVDEIVADQEDSERLEDEFEEEKAPLYIPEKLQPEKQRIKQFLREIEKILYEIFDNNLDQFDLDKIRYQIKKLIQTFKFSNCPLQFDRKTTLLITVLLLEILLKYRLLTDEDDEVKQESDLNNFREKFQQNPVLFSIIKKFHLSDKIIDENLEKIWSLK